MKVLLTGADGFLGSHIMRELIKKGHSVRAFLQESRDHSTIEGLEYEPHFGDLLNESDVDTALKDCDALVHTVAITDVWPGRNPFIWKVNYDATRTLAKLVIRHSLKRFVYIGTANSFGYGTKNKPGSEDSPFNSGKYKLDYIDSKKAAQDYLLEQNQTNGLPVVIINPSFMIGEYDTKPGSGRMVLSVIQGKVPSCAPGGRCFTYVGDVAAAAVNALTIGDTGECYITGGANLNYKEFFAMVAGKAGVKAPSLTLPAFLLLPMAWLMELAGAVFGKPPLLSRAMVRVSLDGHYYTSEKAHRHLQMPSTDINEAVKRTIVWFRKNGYC